MKYSKFIYLIASFFLFILFACNQKKATPPTVVTPVVKLDSPAKAPILSQLKFDSKKDLVCGMPISAGVSDTCMYKGKLYGFCAKECKEDFLKDPGSYLSVK